MKVVTTNLLNRFWKNGVKPIKTALAGKFDASKVVASRNITEAGYVMEGKTASEALAELNRKLKWNYLGTVTSTAEMLLPDGWSELDIIVKQTTTHFLFHVNSEMVNSSAIYPRHGLLYENHGFFCTLEVYPGRVKLSGFVRTDLSPYKITYLTSQTSTEVYYR